MSAAACLSTIIVVSLYLATAYGVSEDTQQESGFVAGLQIAHRVYQQCEEQEDTLSCLKVRALKFVDRALRKESIPLIDGITLVKTAEGSRALLESPPAEVEENSLPSDLEQRHERLDALLMDRVGRFLGSHSLQLDMPRYLLESRQMSLDSLVQEGRGKGGGGGGGGGLKKYGGAMAMGLMMKAGLMAMAFKGVALLAGKALMVAKMALVLAAVAGLGKLLGGGGGDKTTYEIVKHPQVSHSYSHSSSHEGMGGGGHYEVSGGGGGGHGYGGGGHGWGRNLDGGLYPQLMAYSGQVQQQQKQQQEQLEKTENNSQAVQ